MVRMVMMVIVILTVIPETCRAAAVLTRVEVREERVMNLKMMMMVTPIVASHPW